MRSMVRFVLFCSLALASFMSASSQITMTAADVSAQLAPGNTIDTKVDTVSPTANIGTLGSTSWDFSGLVTNYTLTSVTVAPDTTPYTSAFPAATHAMRSGSVYSYFELATDLSGLGFGNSTPFDVRSWNDPPQVVSQLPMTFGTSWTSSYVESTVVSLPPPLPPVTTIATRVVVNTVDAYGSMTLPGGGVYAALRLKIDIRTTVNSNTTRLIMYQFLAKNGATVSVAAADTLQADTGAIAVSTVTWSGPTVPTAAEDLGGSNMPSRFALEQNYPNPFNPSTTIRFSVAEDAAVTLKIYDLLGRELATLTAGRFTPGTYSIPWDGSGLSSGVYLYRLQAGTFLETKKLMLMR